jgi:hypothetical protein
MLTSLCSPNLRYAFVLLAFLSAPINLSAQSANGALRGAVEDTSGARIAGARVTVQSASFSITRQGLANDRGEFRIEGLLPGHYHVVAAANGFEDANSEVDIAVSLVRDISVVLKPHAGRESVSVQANASSITTQSIDTASAIHEGVVAEQDLQTLPLPARSFANIAYIVPGTPTLPRRASPPSPPVEARV